MLATKIDKLSEPGPGVSEMMTFPMDQNGSGCTGAFGDDERRPLAGLSSEKAHASSKV